MKKSIKTISLILCAILCMTLVTGCGQDPAGTTEAESATENAAAVTSADGTQAEADAEALQDVSIVETVLLDRDGIRITAKELKMDGRFGPELKLLFENDSGRSVVIQSAGTSVNGYMIEPVLSVEVEPEKKANESAVFMRADVEKAGIVTFADVEMSFHVVDGTTWQTVFDAEAVRLETSAADGFKYEFDNSGSELYNENGIEIVAKGVVDDDAWLGKALLMYVSNTSGRDVTVQCENVSVNGFMTYPIFSASVLDGKHAIGEMTFLSDDLEANGIKTVETIELIFRVYDSNTYETVADTEPITITFDQISK